MSKGIAIRTILLLLVGILVVGILVYMVYRYFIASPLSEQECRARAISWCTACRNVQSDPTRWLTAGPAPSSELTDCASSYFAPFTYTDCIGTPQRDWCASFIPVD